MAISSAGPVEHMNDGGGSVGATFGTVLRNVWLVGLGVVAVAVEQTQEAVKRLQQKGSAFEPSITTPLAQAGEAAGRVVQRGANAAKSIDFADFKARAEKLVDERIAAALDRLEMPRREDLHELSRRIDVLAAEQKRQG